MLAAGARFVRETRTAPEYRLWSIAEETLGVLEEPALYEGQPEITHYGGWRACVAARGGAQA